MIGTILYNLILFGLDLAALLLIIRKKTVASWFFSASATVAIGTLLAVVFARDHFDFCRLAAYLVFLHGTLLSAGSAVVIWRAKKWVAIVSILSSAVLASVACYVFLIEPFWLDVSYRQISSPKIERSIRIVVVADFQTDRFGDYERSVLRRVMQEKPDIILLAGDYIHVRHEQYQSISRDINNFLREINFSAPNGIYGVKGNIDPPNWHEIFDGLNVTTVDLRKSFDVGPVQLTCLELAEAINANTHVKNPDTSKFHIVLGHAPDFALGKIEGDLMMAGHTHGGQVRFPLIGPIITHSRIPNAWAAGFTELPSGAKLLVSRGIGMERGYAPRMRFLCRPELLVIDLIPEKVQ